MGRIAMYDLGIKIRQARKERKLTQAQLAEMAGIARKTLSQIETGIVPDIGIQHTEAGIDCCIPGNDNPLHSQLLGQSKSASWAGAASDIQDKIPGIKAFGGEGMQDTTGQD